MSVAPVPGMLDSMAAEKRQGRITLHSKIFEDYYVGLDLPSGREEVITSSEKRASKRRSFQREGSNAKPYQVRQVIILKHHITGED